MRVLGALEREFQVVMSWESLLRSPLKLKVLNSVFKLLKTIWSLNLVNGFSFLVII